MPDYDPTTQTVAADDGSRMSVFDVFDCPKCGGPLIHWGGEGPEIAMCPALGCYFIVHREPVR